MLTDIEIAQRAKLLPDRRRRVASRDRRPTRSFRTAARRPRSRSTGSRASRGVPTASSSWSRRSARRRPAKARRRPPWAWATALNRIGKKAAVCLREPSLGPVFGMKGGAAGGGYAQVVPMEDINLHFTGDFHAIGVANNLLAALLDNHIHHGNALGIDVRRITWKRVMDMNDRALRDITVALGGPGNGFPRQDGFDIVVASEVMAIFCLSRVARGSQDAARQHRRRLHARPEARARARPRRARRDDGAAEGRAAAQPRADAREQSGVHPRRPVRQHRARLQLGDRDQDGAEALPTTSSPKPDSARTWARRSSSTSSAASPDCGRASSCWSRRSARSSITAAPS